MFGYSKRDIVGQNINAIIPEPISIVHQEYMQHYVRSGKEVRPLLLYVNCRFVENPCCNT